MSTDRLIGVGVEPEREKTQICDQLQVRGGFIKGTRVHTNDGLKPIEEIKVGDYVLSSHEDGTGEPEFKRVLKTFVHPNKTVIHVRFYGDKPNTRIFFGANGNHPVWVEGIGWIRADALEGESQVRKANGSIGTVALTLAVYRTSRDGVGWITNGRRIREMHGTVFDYASYEIVETRPEDEYLSDEVLDSEDPFLRVTVYNIEVEDHHTFYVGKAGIWVHD